jgi:hypothetical protein
MVQKTLKTRRNIDGGKGSLVYECVHMCVRVERREKLRDALGRSRNLTQDVEAFLHGVKVF